MPSLFFKVNSPHLTVIFPVHSMFTLILPSFLRPHDEATVSCNTPTLNQWLRHGIYQAHDCNTAELYHRYLSLPVLPANTAYAVPLWQQMGMNTTQQLDSRHLNISQEEALLMVQELNQFYVGDATFHAVNPHIWHITLPEISPWHVPSILDTTQQIDAISRSEHHAAAQWLQLSTEIQMFLHNHPLNQARQARGDYPINALWLWQNKTPSYPVQAALSGSNSVWADMSSQPHTAQPYDLAAWQRACDEFQTPLEHSQLFSEDFLLNGNTDDIWAYQTTLEQWEIRFFAPLETLLRTGKLSQLQLVCEQGSLTVNRQRWAFWKRKKSFNGKQLG